MQAHYRSKQNFTWEALEGARNGYEHLINQISVIASKAKQSSLLLSSRRRPGSISSSVIASETKQSIGHTDPTFKTKFSKIIGDDFGISQALALLQEVLKSDIPKENKLATIYDFDKVLGLDLQKAAELSENIPDEIIKLAEERKLARSDKNWSKSDELRDKIASLGYEIKDSSAGYEISKK